MPARGVATCSSLSPPDTDNPSMVNSRYKSKEHRVPVQDRCLSVSMCNVPSSFIGASFYLRSLSKITECANRGRRDNAECPACLADTWPDLNYVVANVNWGSSVAQLITCCQTGHRSPSDWCNSSPCCFQLVLIAPVEQIRNTLIHPHKDTIRSGG